MLWSWNNKEYAIKKRHPKLPEFRNSKIKDQKEDKADEISHTTILGKKTQDNYRAGIRCLTSETNNSRENGRKYITEAITWGKFQIWKIGTSFVLPPIGWLSGAVEMERLLVWAGLGGAPHCPLSGGSLGGSHWRPGAQRLGHGNSHSWGHSQDPPYRLPLGCSLSAEAVQQGAIYLLDGHWGCFHLLSAVDNDVMGIGVQHLNPCF